jgi:hypothetical protein
MQKRIAEVRDGSNSEVRARKRQVSFAPKNRHRRPNLSGPLWAHIPNLAPQQDTHAADHLIGVRELHRGCRTLVIRFELRGAFV